MKTRRKHMKSISRLGVEARRAKRAAQLIPRAAYPPALEGREPETLKDWQLLGAAAAKAMWTGGIPHQIAKEIASLVRASLAAFKVADLATKLERAEQLLATIEVNGSVSQQQEILRLKREVETLRATRQLPPPKTQRSPNPRRSIRLRKPGRIWPRKAFTYDR